MMWRIALLVSVLSAALSSSGVDAEEKKWRWGDGDSGATARQDRELARTRTANEYLSNKDPSARYEIFENNDGGNFHNPGRPHDFRPPVDYQEMPGFAGGIRPGRPGGLYGNEFGNGGYGNGGGAILTGPVPSWQREPHIKEFDRCKCTEKFNCNSPGISYGHCDVGKKYCCYNTNGIQGSPIPSRPHHSLQNGILSGPGGPVDHLPGGRPQHGLYTGGGTGRPPFRPSGDDLQYPRPPHGPDVLVGPGGPTGIIGRPQGYGDGQGIFVGHGGPSGIGGKPSGYGTGSGVLVGPGGPTGIIGRPHGHGVGQGGLLVGPGGPTGVGGRPPGGYGNGGSFGIGGAGLLVGPAGPHDRPNTSGFGGIFRPAGFGIGRSAKDLNQEEKHHNE